MIILKKRSQLSTVMVIMCFRNIDTLRHVLGGLLHSSGGMKDQMERIQRVFNMSEIPQEASESKIQENEIKESWPQKAQIKFNDVKLRYRPNTEQVLKGLSFEIQGGHKIGIVGRTGAGKSTLSLALTRIVEIENGSIEIDGVNIHEIPLKKLRQKITMIP